MLRTRVITGAVALAVAGGAVWLGTAGRDDGQGSVDGPVIAVAGWNSYPAAEIRGELRLVEGCLLIDQAVVLWEEGTSWDAADEAVVFENADPVRVGAEFTGGGGHYTAADVGDLGGLDTDAVDECLRRTGSNDAVIATASR